MNNIKDNGVLIGCLCAVCCEFFYGLSYMFTKTATETASAFALLGWRFLIAVTAMTVLIVLGFAKVDFKGKNFKPLLIVAVCNPCIYFIAETIGINRTTASESGALLAVIPVFSLIASTVILKKKPTKAQVTGILTTLAGVLITVSAVGLSSSVSIIGYGFLVAAIFSYSLYCVFVDKSAEFTGIEITYIMLISGSLLFVALALVEAAMAGNVIDLITLPFNDVTFLSAVLYQGLVCSVVAFFMSNVAIAKIGVNRTASFIGISTVISIISGILVLGESFSPLQAIGVVIIIAGVYIANYNLKEEF